MLPTAPRRLPKSPPLRCSCNPRLYSMTTRRVQAMTSRDQTQEAKEWAFQRTLWDKQKSCWWTGRKYGIETASALCYVVPVRWRLLFAQISTHPLNFSARSWSTGGSGRRVWSFPLASWMTYSAQTSQRALCWTSWASPAFPQRRRASWVSSFRRSSFLSGGNGGRSNKSRQSCGKKHFYGKLNI